MRLNDLKVGVNRILAIPQARRTYEAGQSALVQLAGSSRFATHLFHSIAPVRFNREQHSVLAGQRRYYANLHKQQVTAPALRRNIHRLEKGLLMRPPRPVFALDYIGETLDFFEAALNSLSASAPGLDVEELHWAHDVLTSYFARTSGRDELRDHRTQFQKLTRAHNRSLGESRSEDSPQRIPYRRGDETPPVKYEDFLALAHRRRSVRWFLDQPVERDLIDQALMAARQAPTACNRMPYEFLIFDEPEIVQEVAGIPFGTTGYAENIPVIIVLVGQLDHYFSPRDRHAIYVDGSLAAMSFMFALETLGLASCAINWPDFEPLERKMSNRLGLEAYERPIMLMAVGYADPDGEIAFSQKKDLATFRHYNRIRLGG